MKGYRTIAFNIIMAALAAVRMFDPDLMLPDEAAVENGVQMLDMGLTFLWTVGNLILRGFTTTSIGSKT